MALLQRIFAMTWFLLIDKEKFVVSVLVIGRRPTISHLSRQISNAGYQNKPGNETISTTVSYF